MSFSKLSVMGFALTGFAFAGTTNSEVLCTERLFVGGPVLTSIKLNGATAEAKLISNTNIKKSDRQEFGSLSKKLQDHQLIDNDEFVDSIKVGFDSDCSQPPSLPTVVKCYSFEKPTLSLSIKDSVTEQVRILDLQTKTAAFSTARRTYEHTRDNQIQRGISFDVTLHVEIQLSENKFVHHNIVQQFHGEDSCKLK